jgi:hypothetical protein
VGQVGLDGYARRGAENPGLGDRRHAVLQNDDVENYATLWLERGDALWSEVDTDKG